MKKFNLKWLLLSFILCIVSVNQTWGTATQRYIYVGISSNYQTYKNGSQYGFNFWGGTSGGVKSGTYLTTYTWDNRTYYMYRVYIHDDNNKAQFKGNDSWYDPDGGFDVTLNGTDNNAVFYSHSSDGWGGQFQQNYQETSTASLSATSTSITTAQTSTLTPSLSTNATYNEILSTEYSVTTNPGSAGSVTSGGVFSATAAGTYTVTATVTYNPKYFTDITKTATATKSITVSAPAETTHTVAITYTCASPSATVSSATNRDIGEESYYSATAPTVYGYTFTSWTLGTGVVKHSSDATTSNPIRIKTNSSGSGYTLQANYTEDLSSTWYVSGAAGIFGGWGSSGKNMQRKTGHSTEKRFYYTIDATKVINGETSDSDLEFKIYNSDGDSYRGNSGYWVTRTNYQPTLSSSSGDNMQFRPDAYGTYEFKVDCESPYSESAPKLTVTFGTKRKVTFGKRTGCKTVTAKYKNSVSMTSNQYVIDGSSVTFSQTANNGYTFEGWYNASTGGTRQSTSSSYTVTVSGGDKTLYPNYTENTHTVTLANGGHGHVEISSSTVTSVSGVGIATASGTITAVPDPGYYFVNWTGAIGSGVTIASGSTTSATITINATADSKTITANFAPIWRIAGGNSSSADGSDAMGDWSTSANQITNITTSAGVMTSGYVEVSLPANTDFQFKVYNASTGYYWGKTSTVTKIIYSNKGTAVTLSNNTGNNQTFRTAVAGTYRFTWTGSQITIGYPTSYKVTFGYGTGGSAVTASGSTTGSISSGDYVAPSENVTFTQTKVHSGYDFKGWYTTADGNTTVSTMGVDDNVLNTIAADATVYAQYTKHTYTNLTLNKTTGSTDGKYSVEYLATNITVTTTPAKTGYNVEGYYKTYSAGVWSDKVATPAGALQKNVTGITDGSNQWTSTSSPTLYTKWNAKNYDVTLDKNGGDEDGSATATYDQTSLSSLSAPSKTGYHVEGYYESNGSSSWGTKVATDEGALQASTTYTDASYHWTNDDNATLYTKWEPNTYTITLNQNGATTDSDPTSLTATYDSNTLASITNPEKTGYTFAGWYSGVGGTGSLIIDTNGDLQANVDSYTGASGIWKKDAICTLYAKWTPKNYTITLTQSGETGYGSAGTTSVSATYDAALPTIASLPTGATGYKFQGYYTDHNGEGTKYYDADGTKLVATYTTDDEITLYAYFQKAEITGLTYDANIAKDEDLVVNPTIDPASGVSGTLAICWTLHYLENNVQVEGEKWAVAAYTEEDSKPNQVKFTFTDLADGLYYVKAVLKAKASSFVDKCDGSEDGVIVLDTKTGNFRVAGNSIVTIRYQDASGNTLRAESSVEIAANATEGVKAPEIVGYTFTEWELGDVLSNECESDASCGTDKDSINISATYNTFLTAKYTKKNLIYFNNTNVNWDQVYVYFYDDGTYWEKVNGNGIGAKYNYSTGSHSPHWYHVWGAMTQIPGTDVWYFDYEAAAALTSMSTDPGAKAISAYTHVAFTEAAQGYPNETYGYEWFYNTKAAYRTDFDHNQSMYVPIDANTVDKNVVGDIKTVYYNTGYWMNYPDGTGDTLKIWDNNSNGALAKERVFPFSANKAMPISITVDLEKGRTYGFKIVDANGQAYGNTGTMSNGHSGDEGQNAPWEFKSNVSNRCGLTTTSAGDYTFTLTYGLDLDKTNYNFHVGVHYPEATGDYRVIYTDDVHSTEEVSKVIPFNLSEDTISYFVRHNQNPVMKLQKCSATYSAGVTTVTWTDTVANLIAELPAAITADGVYYFCINKNAETGKRELGDTKPYEGNFYIRVDGAGYSGWDNFRASDHIMPYSDYSFNQGTDAYSHYFTKWYDVSGGKNKNIKFVVANDYSVHISDTIVQDGLTNNYVDAYGWLHDRSANVRFMYNYKTNVATRRYVDGAQGATAGDFLKMYVENANTIYVRNHANTADSAVMEVKFSDKGNWIYEANVKAKPGATYRLKSSFGTVPPGVVEQYFKGTSSSYEQLIGGSGATLLDIRLLYDFKTNRLVTAYVPSGTIENDTLHINADLMFVREHQGDITEVKFNNGAIKDIKTVYSVLRFNKYTLNNREKTGEHNYLSPMLSRYERDLFYVSFPYNVKVSDIIGFGTYGQHWIIEYYDGAARAKEGFWVDSESFWKFVTPAMKDTFTLKAGTGYIVALDLDELYYISESLHASIWDNTDITNLELLFPGKVSSISETSATYTMPEHTCTINRGTTAGNRTIKDSHWNVLGVPTFKNITGAASGEPDEGVGSGALVFAHKAWVKDSLKLKFIYDGNLADNSLSPKAVKGFEFKAMHAYVVQYCGNVTFTTSASPAPASVAARTYADAPQEVYFRMELSKDGVVEDQTFVSLSNDEDVSADFVFGEDMSKEFNANRANIYTYIGTEWVAGNTLPMSEQTTVVPVGVKIATDGEYTFAIPEGTEGIGVVLVDNVANTRTNLGLTDYSVTLSAGTIDGRFVLEISPISQNPTDVELINGENGGNGVRKVIIDQKMYIIRGNEIFDARGAKVK